MRETRDMARKSSEKLAQLTEGLLELVVLEKQPLKRQPVDLRQVVTDVQDLLAGVLRDEQATVVVDQLPVVESNAQMMQRVFLNLFSNALKYRHADRKPQIDVSALLLDDSQVEISVADNGIGIAPKFAEKIFQPMERLHAPDLDKGSGLGLPICQRILEKHGGSIRLDLERQEEGARFIMTIPQDVEYLNG